MKLHNPVVILFHSIYLKRINYEKMGSFIVCFYVLTVLWRAEEPLEKVFQLKGNVQIKTSLGLLMKIQVGARTRVQLELVFVQIHLKRKMSSSGSSLKLFL